MLTSGYTIRCVLFHAYFSFRDYWFILLFNQNYVWPKEENKIVYISFSCSCFSCSRLMTETPPTHLVFYVFKRLSSSSSLEAQRFQICKTGRQGTVPCFQLPGTHFRSLINSLVQSICFEEEVGGIQMRDAVCQDQSSIAHFKEFHSQTLRIVVAPT